MGVVGRLYREALEKGLDMSQAGRLARARGMGFDTDTVYYHGAARDGYVSSTDIESFDPTKTGDRWGADDSGFFFTSDPSEASYYAKSDRDYRFPGEGEGAVYPAHLRATNPLLIDADYLAG